MILLFSVPVHCFIRKFSLMLRLCVVWEKETVKCDHRTSDTNLLTLLRNKISVLVIDKKIYSG